VAEFETLQATIGYTFADNDLLRLALTHPSVAHEQGGTVRHNQRLEFLGDAVLGLVITRELYERFPSYGEGPLTKGRARLVNGRTLAIQGRRLGLGDHLILSRGEELNQGRHRASALADTFEALVGAIFIDGGFEPASEFVLRCFQDAFGEVTGIPNIENPKGELQEILQSRSQTAPHYELTSISGPDHDRDFEAIVYHEGKELGRGRGKSKKAAESEAALHALNQLRQTSGGVDAAPELETPASAPE
jgi:ribonuclease III